MSSESSTDLHSELMEALQNVALSLQSDEVDEGFKPSELFPQNLTATVAQVTSPHLSSVGEIPRLVEVWGIDPLMKKFFESIYPNSTSCYSTHQ